MRVLIWCFQNAEQLNYPPSHGMCVSMSSNPSVSVRSWVASIFVRSNAFFYSSVDISLCDDDDVMNIGRKHKANIEQTYRASIKSERIWPSRVTCAVEYLPLNAQMNINFATFYPMRNIRLCKGSASCRRP